jgi:hypothetical protein
MHVHLVVQAHGMARSPLHTLPACSSLMTGGLKYQKDCQLLRAAAELLRLPQPVVATSLAFLHRFHCACPEDTLAIEVCILTLGYRVHVVARLWKPGRAWCHTAGSGCRHPTIEAFRVCRLHRRASFWRPKSKRSHTYCRGGKVTPAPQCVPAQLLHIYSLQQSSCPRNRPKCASTTC